MPPASLLGLAVVLITTALSTLTGLIITVSGVPDIIVTLAASFTLSGLALFIIGGPGGGTSPDFQRLFVGGFQQLLALGVVDDRRHRPPLDPVAQEPRRARDLRRRQRPQGGVPVRRRGRPHPGRRLRGRRFPRRVRRHRHDRLHRRWRTTGDDRRQRHAQQRGGGRARRGGASRRRWRPHRPRARRLVPVADPGDHARPRLGPEQRRDRRGVIIILVVLVAGLLQSRRRRA